MRKSRPGGRTAQTRAAVFTAVETLLADKDPGAISMAEIAEPYTNPLGVTRRPCGAFGTTLATPLNTVDPFARASGLLTVR